MMQDKDLERLLKNNRKWALKKTAKDPQYFAQLAVAHKPKYLWIGCSDSRMCPMEMLDLSLGDLFIHRNVANLFLHTDLSSHCVLQYALEYLGVECVIVCGHYGCGGVAAAMEPKDHGLLEQWIRCIRDIYDRERGQIEALAKKELRYRRLVEINVSYQVMNVCHTTIAQKVWSSGRRLTVCGWIYDLATGTVSEPLPRITSLEQIGQAHRLFP